VTDANRLGLANVTVAIVGVPNSIITNERGEFTVDGLQPGTHRLTVRRVGYDPVSRDLAVGAGQTTTADVVLRPSQVSLSEVVVTGAAASRSVAQDRGKPRALSAPVAAAEAAPGAAVTAPQSSAVGCYDMGITPNSQQARASFRQTPRRVALDAEIVPSNADGVWYRARDLAQTGAVPNGLWRPVGTDGIELEWTYGSLLARVRLTGPVGTMMRGTVEELDRSRGTGEAGTVVSVRTSCAR
jgi:hypothetical protein